jgi:hypothetical protein
MGKDGNRPVAQINFNSRETHMEDAIRYTELMNAFVGTLLSAGHKTVEVLKGRRFDRLVLDDAVHYFVDTTSWTIYGAKSGTQYNPRREYGDLGTVDQYDWQNNHAKAGTELAAYLDAREAQIAVTYKKRGRPRKVLVGAP